MIHYWTRKLLVDILKSCAVLSPEAGISYLTIQVDENGVMLRPVSVHLEKKFLGHVGTCLTCFSINCSSLFFSTQAAVPDRSTGPQYIWWASIVDAGFALCLLASPTGKIIHNWLLWAEYLAWSWARFSCTDLVTLTWSSKSTLIPCIWILWGVLEQEKLSSFLDEKNWSLVLTVLSEIYFFLQK